MEQSLRVPIYLTDDRQVTMPIPIEFLLIELQSLWRSYVSCFDLVSDQIFCRAVGLLGRRSRHGAVRVRVSSSFLHFPAQKRCQQNFASSRIQFSFHKTNNDIKGEEHLLISCCFPAFLCKLAMMTAH
eukprot:scaffold34458_cov49-Cyclotella_meneghiniana.AAC.4